MVDEQVMRWAHALDDEARPARTRLARETVAARGSDETARPDRLGLHYWGDAIVAELIRVMEIGESAEGFLNEGLVDRPTISTPEAGVHAASAGRTARATSRRASRHAWWRRRRGGGKP